VSGWAARNDSATVAVSHGPPVTVAASRGLPHPSGFVSSGEVSMRNRILLALALAAGLPLAAHAQASATAAAPGSSCAEIPIVGGDAAAVSVPSAPDAWGGPRTGAEETLSDRVVRYSINATLDPVKHTIEGKQQLTWRNRSAQPVCSVFLHLYLNAFEGPGSTFMTELRENNDAFRSDVRTKDGEWGYIELRKVEQGGAPVQWSFVQPDGGPATDRTVVRL